MYVLYRPSNQISNKIYFSKSVTLEYFLYQLNFDFGFFINHDEIDCVSEQFRKKECIKIAIFEAVCLFNSPLLER